MAARDLSTSSMTITPEEVQRLVKRGFVTQAGVPVHEELAGSNGMSFVLIASPGITEEQLEASARELRADRDVVGSIRVVRTLGKGMVELVQLWIRLGDIPTTPDGEDVDCIEEPFLHFPVGTHREDIWHWFEEQNHRFMVGPLMSGAYTHPIERVNLKSVVEGICNACELHKHPLPVTLDDARSLLKKMIDASPHQWLTGNVWLEVLDAVIDGRKFQVAGDKSPAP